MQSQGRCLCVLEERAFVIGSDEVGVAFEIVLEPHAGTMGFCYRYDKGQVERHECVITNPK